MRKSVITKGNAIITQEGIRCNAPRQRGPNGLCHKLIAKFNKRRELCGSLMCERCGQIVEAELVEARNAQ